MSIYGGPGRAQRVLTIGGVDLNDQLANWTAHTVVVDNHTNQYVYLEDAGPVGRYVAPWIVGATMPLPAVMRAKAKIQTPPGAAALSPIAGQQAILSYYEEAIDPSPGVALPNLPGSAPTMQQPKRIFNNAAVGIANAFRLLALPTTGNAYLWSITLTLDAAAAAGNGLYLFDGDPNNGGTEIAEVSESSIGPFLFMFRGSPMSSKTGVPNGLWYYKDAAAFVRGTIVYSLG